MNTVPQPGTLLKLKTAPIIAHGAPDDQIYTQLVTRSMYTGTATVLMHILLANGEIMHIPIPEDSIPLGGRLHRWFEELS